jgi:predicted ATPase
VLKQIKISGFKAIKDSGLVELGPMNLLIGRNGSGKSSLVEALQWLQGSIFHGLRESTLSRFAKVDGLVNRTCDQISIRLSYDDSSRPTLYTLTVSPAEQGLLVSAESCGEGRSQFKKPTIQSKKVANGPVVRSISGGNPVRDDDALALASVTKTKALGAERLLEFLRSAVFLRLSPTAMALPGRLLPRTRGPALDEEGRDIVALLNQLTVAQRANVAKQVAEVISGVEEISVVSEVSEGYFQTHERMRARGRGGTRTFQVPSWMLSEGTRRITAIFALLAMEPRPSLIAIEEIENGLDPWTLQFVLGALREAANDGVQIILTTHSPFLLDHVDISEVIHVRRNNGDTQYRPITSFDDVVNNQGVVAPGAMYIAGYMRDAEEPDGSA